MKKNKFLFLFAILLTLTMVTSTTYAAVVEFYKDTGRIQVTGGTFNYSHNAVAGVTVSDGNLFTITTSGNKNFTFTIYGSTVQPIYYAFYFEQASSGFNLARTQSGAYGTINAGVTSVNRTVRLTTSSRPATVRVGIILVTQAEFNSKPGTITDSYANKTYTIMGSY